MRSVSNTGELLVALCCTYDSLAWRYWVKLNQVAVT